MKLVSGILQCSVGYSTCRVAGVVCAARHSTVVLKQVAHTHYIHVHFSARICYISIELFTYDAHIIMHTLQGTTDYLRKRV
jgi:hypothetical protein